jgi:hypothetical protein
MQRSELTRIRDTDGDGRGDHYETVNADCGVSTTQHAYIFGPVPDREGNWWGAISALGAAGQGKYFGWSFKITPDGAFHPWSSGLRSPNGILVTPEGEVFITDNQGEFMGTSPLHHVSRGAFHGHPHGLRYENGFQGDPFRLPIEELEKRRKPPAILFPYGSMGQSISQPLTDTTGGKFGPFQGQVFIGDVTKCNLMRVTLEKVEGEFQGACYPFRSGFQSGNNRLAFGPDGSLYVGQTDRGWGSVGGKSHGLQRVVWTGRTPFEIQEVRATSSGFELQFTRPVDRQTASQPAHYAIQHYYYRYHSAYGSPQVGNTPVAVASATVSPDGLRVQLTLPELVPLRIYEVACPGVKSRDQEAVLHPVAYYTLNRVPGRPGRLAAP